MKLYTYFRSSAAYRTRIALNLKGLDYEPHVLNLRIHASEQQSAAYRAVNPQGFVPALETDYGVITQSLAIIEFLEETHPDPPLLPRAPIDRARVRAMALAIACDIHPLNNLRVLNYLRSPLQQDDEAVNAWYRHWIAEGFRALEQAVSNAGGDGRHMYGSAVTMADVCIVPQMYNARRLKCDVQPYPKLTAICAHLEALPAFAKAAPERQGDVQ